MLFAAHTYYALLVKLLVWHIWASFHKLPALAEQMRMERD